MLPKEFLLPGRKLVDRLPGRTTMVMILLRNTSMFVIVKLIARPLTKNVLTTALTGVLTAEFVLQKVDTALWTLDGMWLDSIVISGVTT